MSHSFGFNRNDTEADYASFETLLTTLIDGAARNGNLLLNVGPRATDAGIPAEQLARLKAFGSWLGLNGAAIYGATPWRRSDGETADGMPVRFTTTDERLNIIFLGRVTSDRVVIKDLSINGEGRVLGDGGPVGFEAIGPDTALTFRALPSDSFAPVAVGPLS